MQISILLSFYNSEQYLSETLNSIISQTYKNWELLIINDASTDNSLNILKKYELTDNRIKSFNLYKNVGKGVALNMLIPNIKSDYIAFIDADDIWENDKLEKQLTFMIEKKADFSFTSYTQFDNDTGIELRRISAMDIVTYKDMLKYSRIGYSTVMIRSELLNNKRIPELRKRQDYALWLMLLKETNAIGINETLTRYRISNGSLSKNKIEMLKWHWRLYRRIEHLDVFKTLYYLAWDIYSKLSKIK